MLKSVYVHLLNKFPRAKVDHSDKKVAAYDSDTGELLMQAEVNGLGQMVDTGPELGAKYSLCLSPIPRDSRRMKICKKSHKVIRDEQHDSRKIIADKYHAEYGMVPSEVQLKHSPKEKDGAIADLIPVEQAVLMEKGV